jgi:hypothetical protein
MYKSHKNFIRVGKMGGTAELRKYPQEVFILKWRENDLDVDWKRGGWIYWIEFDR